MTNTTQAQRKLPDVFAMVDAFGAAMEDKGRTGHVTASAYAKLARSNLLDAIAAAQPEPEPAQVPLTDEQAIKLIATVRGDYGRLSLSLVRAIEAAHGIQAA